VTIPAAVVAIASGRDARLVWDNEVGGLTYAVGDVFIRWVPAGSHLGLDRERHRLAWAVRYTAVPTVVDHGRDADGSWLVTRALAGDNAIAARWVASPAPNARVTTACCGISGRDRDMTRLCTP
jgi:kanamycin kinase